MKVGLLTLTSLASLGVLSFVGCGLTNGFSEAGSIQQTTFGTPVDYLKVDLNLHPLDKTICDPFSGGETTNLSQGVKGSLYYLTSGMSRLSSADDYTTLAVKSNQTLFFADINVPTRAFTEGFATQTNDYLKDDVGNKLIEYFGVKFETVLQLQSQDAEGDYEFALLSDDGTVLRSGNGDNQTVLIDNDGDHPTMMGCSQSLVHLTHGSQLPLTLTYYQGPRYHIANVLLWRRASQAGQDPSCGQQGNDFYFDPSNGSAPQQHYKDLLSRGWKVVDQNNFFIPPAESYNPCVQGTAPVITNFQSLELTSSTADLTWQTNIPSTSQIKITNVATGEIILTTADNALRTSHSVRVSGLQSGTTYTAQAVSVSQDLGNALSTIIQFTTL